jgi:hypothetical protein
MPDTSECTVRELRDLVRDCWSDDAADRPAFAEAVQRVGAMRRRFSNL